MPLLMSARAQLSSPLPIYTRAEARMLGIPLRPETWMRVRKGLYVERAAYAELSPERRYAVRVHAFLRLHPDAILCLESAAIVHGLPGFGEPKDIHLFDPGLKKSWRHADVITHTSADLREVELVQGIYVTSLRDTIIDLARVAQPAHALAMTDAALSIAQGGHLDIEELRDHGAAQKNQRGRARMRWLWENADARSESPAESVSRAVIHWSGFERPELQREFRYDGYKDRTDFYFASCRAIGESDGWGKYELDDPGRASEKLKEEKRREDRLRRHGHPFARWEMRDAWRVTPLCDALVAAGIPVIEPQQSAMLATLRSNPRAKPAPRRRAASETGFAA